MLNCLFQIPEIMNPSKDLVLGVDFGTTNSSAAVFDNNQVKLFDVDDKGANSKTLKSSIYINKNHGIFVGDEAIQNYTQDFEGKEIKTDRRLTDEWLDIIQGVEGELSRERLVEEYEVDLPGRFIVSPKRVMPNRFFTDTEAFGKIYTAEDLATIILKKIKERADEQMSYDFKSVNIGRPVTFSDTGSDELALQRIEAGARAAGFTNITFTYEPVGAAYNFAMKNKEKKLGLVFDFGGGTFDTTVAQFNPDHTMNVIANGGVYIGGNKFNENLILSKFMPYFGRDIKWGAQSFPMPDWIMENASRWEMSVIMRKKDNIEMLENVRRQSDNPKVVENLIKLIKNNLGLSLFLLAENSKIALTDLIQDEILPMPWEKFDINLNEQITQSEFKKIMWPDVGRISQTIRQVLAKANVTAEDIQVIVKTGGSSKTFFISEFLGNTFPNAEVFTSDAYTDVTAGLAIGGANLIKN